MSIWHTRPNPEALNRRPRQDLGSLIGLQFTEVGDDYLCATMPVETRTHQPFGRLHGGASATLAEELGSTASMCCVDTAKHIPVGLELNCNHLRGKSSGIVTATARPLHLGRGTHVWDIRIADEQGKLVCVARLTTSIIEAALMAGRR